jgi:hypothetical protein
MSFFVLLFDGVGVTGLFRCSEVSKLALVDLLATSFGSGSSPRTVDRTACVLLRTHAPNSFSSKVQGLPFPVDE